MKMETLMTYEQAADVLQLKVSGLRKVIARRDLKVVDLGYRSKRIKPSDLEKYIERKTK